MPKSGKLERYSKNVGSERADLMQQCNTINKRGSEELSGVGKTLSFCLVTTNAVPRE